MSEQKKQQMVKIVPRMLLGSIVFSVFFGGIIALTSKFTFIGATSFIFLALMAIEIPTFIWFGVIEPLWWDKLSDKTRENTRNWGCGLFLLSLFVLYPAGMFGGDKWSGKGQINLFPEGATSKNYRLTADIAVETKFWWHKEYIINSVEWPDTGKSYLSDCVLTDSNNTCVDNEGRSWRIEIVEAPERVRTSE
jgi:hypothetical protein